MAYQATAEQVSQIIRMLRTHSRQQSTAAAAELERCAITPLTGGYNNMVFSFVLTDEQVCAKLYRIDDRQRAEREWRALHLLREHGLEVAPRPVWYDPDPTQPVVVMERVPGQPLSERMLRNHELATLAHTLKCIYAGVPTTADFPFRRIGHPAEIVSRIEQWAASFVVDPAIAETAVVRRLLERWLAGPDRHLLTAPAPRVFSAGDSNLGNYLWDGSHMWCVDWEYAGWSDRAYQLADTVEGIWARAMADDVWAEFAGEFDLDASEQQRYRAARRTFALLWILLLIRRGGWHEPRIPGQVQRAEHVWATT